MLKCIKEKERNKTMFWNKIAGLYDLFENIYNKKVYTGTGKKVAEYINSEDEVLECACGTGAISIYIAEKCKSLIATDFAEGMLKQASKKCRHFKNVTFQKADITKLEFADASFDKVVAGNVIHLLPEPEKALAELKRVTKPGGTAAVKFIELLGANFKRQFDFESYKQFFTDMGYSDVTYEVVDGRMPCALAVIKN
jgi:ubiquinone/menaquinone biosynthesis C-methylase UbiE